MFGSLAFGPMKMAATETAILTEKFALVSTDSVEDTDQGGVRNIKKTKLTRVEGKWTRVKTEGEETTTRVFMLAEFQKQVGAVDAGQLALIVPLLKVEQDGDAATVTIPGQDESPFHLRKAATGWVITRFPR